MNDEDKRLLRLTKIAREFPAAMDGIYKLALSSVKDYEKKGMRDNFDVFFDDAETIIKAMKGTRTEQEEALSKLETDSVGAMLPFYVAACSDAGFLNAVKLLRVIHQSPPPAYQPPPVEDKKQPPPPEYKAEIREHKKRKIYFEDSDGEEVSEHELEERAKDDAFIAAEDSDAEVEEIVRSVKARHKRAKTSTKICMECGDDISSMQVQKRVTGIVGWCYFHSGKCWEDYSARPVSMD